MTRRPGADGTLAPASDALQETLPGATPEAVSSRANPLLVTIRRLVRDGAAYRRTGKVWLEGDHLCSAALARGMPAATAVLTEKAWATESRRMLARHARRMLVVPDELFRELSQLESPSDIGYVCDLPASAKVDSSVSAVVLDRVQDAGNVGSILRSAAALGVSQVLAIKGTAALWSPKVLRAGMGAHFALRLIEGLNEDEVLELGLPLVGTSSHGGQDLPLAELPWPAAWLMGHEGQGVSARLVAACVQTVRIPQPGGEESLNVAAAAAICLYESLRRRG
jgi:RNA methyltransferase, TrmH family